ncbi:hypothetical protein [Xenophilus sp. Marseille-Q4582]|uniref:hypothetical protein n=1 Tax=Xenophilus sp. Marseille-Q4582 TaxID=2866600 RepID=UPI001CE4600B|nr:hypothetical protein [Xenophilus sp. Marseille-Q4582]
MNRCPTPHPPPLCFRLRVPQLAAACLLAVALQGPAQAQETLAAPVQTQNEAALGGRNFPVNTLRGKIAFGVFPEVELDGRAERLAPGARIRNAQNMLAVPSTLGGQYLAVNYRRDAAGLVSDVWILTPTEAGAARVSAGGTPFLNFWPFVSRAENE